MKFSRIWAALACLAFLLSAGRLVAQSAGEADLPSDPGGSSSIVPNFSGGSGGGASPPSSSSLGGLGGAAQPPADQQAAGTGAAKLPEETPAPIKLPTGYGGALPSILTPGEGRFAQPPIRFSLSLSQGFDDNVFSAPDQPVIVKLTGTTYKLETQPTGLVYLQTQSGTNSNQVPIGGFKGLAPQVRQVVVPVLLHQSLQESMPKVGSAVTRTNLGFQTQSAASRTVYTLDLGLGATDYWSRPGTQLEYNGSGSFLFYHRVTPRATFTAAGSATTASQPNFGNLYGPTSQTSGQYVSGNFRMNLGYQLTPRISTNLSYNVDTTLYQQSTEQAGNLFNNTVGAELNYLISPRATANLSYRTSAINYTQSASSNSREHFLLFGGDLDLTSRVHFNFRSGAQSKVYDQASSTGLSSPYFESGLTYLYGHGSSLNWTTRYGFEETPSRNITQKTVSLRTGVGANQTLTARISANASANFNRVTTTSTLLQSTASSTQDQINLGLGLNYVVNPHLTLNLSYTFTELLTDVKSADYTRNQTFFGATYAF